MKNYFFIDSKGKASADQYVFAFENGMFQVDDVDVIIKFHLRSFIGNIKAWLKYRFRIKFVFKRYVLSKEGGNIFYFFNSVENIKLIKNRNYVHIFLGHGESNKRASLHPLYRVYDYLLVAGPYANQRMVKYDLLNPFTAAERVLDIGGIGVANIECEDLMHIGDGEINSNTEGLLYMPTWEGGLEVENYSTLVNPLLFEFLLESAKKFSVDVIFIKPHFNTGNRIKNQKVLLANLMSDLVGAGIRLIISRRDLSILPFQRRRSFKGRKCYIEQRRLHFVCAIVDVSAAESMAAKIDVPSIVLISGKMDSFAPDSYFEEKGSSIVCLKDWSSMKECAAHIYVQAKSNYQHVYANCFTDDSSEKFHLALEYIKVRTMKKNKIMSIEQESKKHKRHPSI